MKKYIRMSNTIEDYRGYRIESVGEEYAIIDNSSDAILDYTKDITSAMEQIDEELTQSEHLVDYYSELHSRSKSAIRKFLYSKDIYNEDGLIPYDATMLNPRGGKRIPVSMKTLSSMVASYNKYKDVQLGVRDTGSGYRIVSEV